MVREGLKNKVTHVAGKRRMAIARATIKEGTGRITVNRVSLENIQPVMSKMRIKETVMLASPHIDVNKIDIKISIRGGGVVGQMDAIASSIARGLLEYSKYNENLLDEFLKYDRTLIAGDHRLTETHKPSQSSKGPRHKRQKSYR